VVKHRPCGSSAHAPMRSPTTKGAQLTGVGQPLAVAGVQSLPKGVVAAGFGGVAQPAGWLVRRPQVVLPVHVLRHLRANRQRARTRWGPGALRPWGERSRRGAGLCNQPHVSA
jgi:hypothetical protein